MLLKRLVLLLAVLVLLNGCAPGTIVATAEPTCEAIRYVCTSRDDKFTEGTAVQVEGNNLAHRKLCPVAGDPCAAVRTKPSPAPRAAEPKTS